MHIRTYSLALVMASLAFSPIVSAQTQSDDAYAADVQRMCKKDLPRHTQEGQRFYTQKNYAKAAKAFEQQAALTDFCANNDEKISEEQSITAYNNVGLAYAKMGRYQTARAWFSIWPDAPASRHNLSQLPAFQPSKTLAGKYQKYAGQGAWSTVTVKPAGQGAYTVSYDGVYMPPRALLFGPNMGDFTTKLAKDSRQTTYRSQECVLDIRFDSNTKGDWAHIKLVKGQSGCGFGMNVSPSGDYLKVD